MDVTQLHHLCHRLTLNREASLNPTFQRSEVHPANPTFRAPLQSQPPAFLPRHNNNNPSSLRRALIYTCNLPGSPIPPSNAENGENHRQNRGPAPGHPLLLPRVLPPKDDHGLLEPARPSRSDVALAAPFIRDGHMGRRRQHRGSEHGARGAVSEGAGTHNLPAPHVYEYEAGDG